MARVYLETSFVSACVTDRIDPASAYRRQASLDWWDSQSAKHELFASAEVVAELSAPGFRHKAAALERIAGLPLLDLNEDVLGLARILVRELVMPAPAAGDAVHVAAACWHEMEYVLTWNVRHLANPNKLNHLRAVCVRMALLPPRIVTPDLLWED